MPAANPNSSIDLEQATRPRRTAISVNGDLVQAHHDREHDVVVVEIHDETGGDPRVLRFAPLEAERFAGVLQDCHDESNAAWRTAPGAPPVPVTPQEDETWAAREASGR